MVPFLIAAVFARGIHSLDLKPSVASELQRRLESARRLGSEADGMMSDAAAKHLATLKRVIEVEERTLRKFEELAREKKYAQLIPEIRRRIAAFKMMAEKIETERRYTPRGRE